MEQRIDGLKKALGDRCDKEVADITAILNELRQQILKELAEPEIQQLELFSINEREQLERNMNSLRSRVEQIPEEIDQETFVIRKRFEDPNPRLFPLAVTYLVPTRLATS